MQLKTIVLHIGVIFAFGIVYMSYEGHFKESFVCAINLPKEYVEL